MASTGAAQLVHMQHQRVALAGRQLHHGRELFLVESSAAVGVDLVVKLLELGLLRGHSGVVVLVLFEDFLGHEGGEAAGGFGISPDGSTAYVLGSEEITSGVFRVFVVNLVTGVRQSQLPIAIQTATEFIFKATKKAAAGAAKKVAKAPAKAKKSTPKKAAKK